MNKMNKKLSIIMLLSCVGNVFSMDGGGAAGGGDQRPLTMSEISAMSEIPEKSEITEKLSIDGEGAAAGGNQRPLTLRERVTKAGQASSKKMRDLGSISSEKTRDLVSKIYVSGFDFADSKKGAALATAACTVGGYKLLELPASQNALSIAANILESSKEKGYAIACQAGSATCSFLSKAGSNLSKAGSIALSKASSVSREAVELIAQHKVGTACVAGLAVAGGAYAYQQYNQGKKLANQGKIALRKLQEAEAAQSLAEFLSSDEKEKQNILSQNILLLGSPDARNYQMFVDMLLQSDLENDLLPYAHLRNADGINDSRTLLMLLCEAGQTNTANKDALVYFKDQADLKGKHIAVDGQDYHGRTALFYAAHYGLENIVDFLIDKLNAKVDIKDVDAANYKRYAGTTEEGCARIKSKLAAKLASQ